MSYLVIAPVLLPLLIASVLLVLKGQRTLQRIISTVGAVATFASAAVLLAQVSAGGILAVQFGSWPAPFGISFVADHLSAIMVSISGLMGVAVAVYALRDIDPLRERLGYHPLFHLLMLGINGAFLTGDLFNLYVWFEVLLISSFVLLTLGQSREQLAGGVHYVTINLVSSLLFLAATGLVYGLTGTLNMADLAVKLPQAPEGLVLAIAMLFVVAFGIKAALFPLFFWLPASYHTPPIAIAAIFAGMLTKVGVYALMRVFTLLFISDIALTHTILFWIALFTMVTGVLGAAAQSDIRRILSFHIISQVGYMILGLSLMTPLSLLGGIFYLTYHIVTKGNLFLIAGIVRWTAGSFELDRVGGLYRYRLPLAMLFLISAFTLAGFPPLAGFWAKLLVVRAAIEVQSWMGAGVALGVGFLTIYSMVKIWIGAFWSSAPDDARPLRPGTPWLLYAPVFALTAFLLLLSFWSEPFMNLAAAAAAEMLDPSQYVGAVLGAEAAALVAGRTP